MTVENRDGLGLTDGQTLYACHAQSLYKASLGNGVMGYDITNTAFKVDDGGTANMLVYVNPGDCIINGTTYAETSTASFTIGTGHTSYKRFDAIVYDQSASTAKLVAGTGAVNPLVPDVDADNDIYLAIVLVPTGEVTAITNADIYDVRAFVDPTEMFLGYVSGTVLIPPSSATGIKFDTDKIDTNSMHAVGTAYVYASYSGIYGFNAVVELPGISTGQTYAQVVDQSGTIWARSFAGYVPNSGGGFSHNLSGIAELNSGQYLQVQLFQNSGSTAAVATGLQKTNFSMWRIGKA